MHSIDRVVTIYKVNATAIKKSLQTQTLPKMEKTGISASQVHLNNQVNTDIQKLDHQIFIQAAEISRIERNAKEMKKEKEMFEMEC